jgi:hypothetical protein
MPADGVLDSLTLGSMADGEIRRAGGVAVHRGSHVISSTRAVTAEEAVEGTT